MKDIALILGVAVLWIALNRWVLPWLGISTCMSCGCMPEKPSTCSVESAAADDQKNIESKGTSK